MNFWKPCGTHQEDLANVRVVNTVTEADGEAVEVPLLPVHRLLKAERPGGPVQLEGVRVPGQQGELQHPTQVRVSRLNMGTLQYFSFGQTFP